MRVIKASAKIESATPHLEELIERAGRVCWKSEDRIAPGTAAKFIETLKTKKHESVLEHGAITVKFVVDRGILAELSRHRICSLSVESTRYCAYNKDKFSGHVTFIDPRPGFPDMSALQFRLWRETMAQCEQGYFSLLDAGAKPQEARNLLPQSLKTEIWLSANPREWRHIFRLRTDPSAHPQMREVMIPLLAKFQKRWPSLFGDISSSAISS